MNRVKTRVAAYGFVTPAVITLALLLLYPFCYGIYISFFKTNLVNKWNFIGLKNYAKVLTEADFYSSMKITLIFTVGVVLGHFICGYAEPGYKGAHRIPGYFTASMALSGSRNC